MSTVSAHLDSIDDLLDAQEAAVGLRVTVERMPDKEDAVKVTPFLASGVCACDVSLEIPKEAIDVVTTTGDKHLCCGKVLSVAQLTFHDAVWSNVLSQLAASGSAPRPFDRAMVPEPAVGPGDCRINLSQCLQYCIRHDPRNTTGCDSACVAAYQRCIMATPTWGL
jgi:hypothetical protein